MLHIFLLKRKKTMLSTYFYYIIEKKAIKLNIVDAVGTVVCAPDDGWKYHPKHVEQFSDINKLCNIAFCWICIGIYLRCTDP
jgi:hypothetical protein